MNDPWGGCFSFISSIRSEPLPFRYWFSDWRFPKPAEKESRLLLRNYKISKSMFYRDRVLGEGHYGRVVKGIDKRSDLPVAIKCVSLGQMKSKSKKADTLKDLESEANILRKLDHENIVALYDFFVDYDMEKVYLVEEYLAGGDLFDKVVDVYTAGSRFEEYEIRTIIRTLSSALDYCHRQGVIHRDIKPENVVFVGKGIPDLSLLKIIDFGFVAERESPQQLCMSTRCGTNGYFAPEILYDDAYSAKCDIWGVGLIFCIIATGEHPLYLMQEMVDQEEYVESNDGRKTKETVTKYYIPASLGSKQYRELTRYDFEINFNSEKYQRLSEDAITIVTDMLKVNPKERPSFRKLLKKKWMHMKSPAQLAAEQAAREFGLDQLAKVKNAA